jgi:hypothetical protein
MNRTIVRVTRNPDDLVPILITRTENRETVRQGRIESLDLTVRRGSLSRSVNVFDPEHPRDNRH